MGKMAWHARSHPRRKNEDGEGGHPILLVVGRPISFIQGEPWLSGR